MHRNQQDWLEIDHYLEVFEKAQQDGTGIDFRDYLPPREHLLYDVILKEVIRVDLEYQSQLGMPRTLEDYRCAVPEFFLNHEAVREVAFEDYRQRHERGERPSPTEYERKYGVDTSRWPMSKPVPRFSSLSGI